MKITRTGKNLLSLLLEALRDLMKILILEF